MRSFAPIFICLSAGFCRADVLHALEGVRLAEHEVVIVSHDYKWDNDAIIERIIHEQQREEAFKQMVLTIPEAQEYVYVEQEIEPYTFPFPFGGYCVSIERAPQDLRRLGFIQHAAAEKGIAGSR